MARPIVFLSDYGLDDEFVGICHGVIARISPETRVVDLTHAVPPQDVLRGALVLAESLPFMPKEAIFLAVVDPGVGMHRLDLAVETGSGAVLVGPDNGLLSLAWDRAGGRRRAVEISSRDIVLAPVSSTFHGRDVFAPAAAHLSAGRALDDLGRDVAIGELVTVQVSEPFVAPGMVSGEVLDLDRFGNVQLNVRFANVEAAGLGTFDRLRVRTAATAIDLRLVSAFGQVGEGEYAALIDARGWLAIVRNAASAAEGLGLGTGDGIILERPTAAAGG